MNWILIWKVVLIGVVSLFGILAVMVTVFGAADIRTMLAELADPKSVDNTDSDK